MTKTAEGERASIMGEHKLHGKDIILRLVQDASRLAHETGERVAVYREDRNRVWDSCYPDNGTHESSGLT